MWGVMKDNQSLSAAKITRCAATAQIVLLKKVKYDGHFYQGQQARRQRLYCRNRYEVSFS